MIRDLSVLEEYGGVDAGEGRGTSDPDPDPGAVGSGVGVSSVARESPCEPFCVLEEPLPLWLM